MHIRAATRADARQLAELIGDVIAAGGAGQLTPLSRTETEAWIVSDPAQSRVLVAENERGELLGFQSIAPHPDLPENACDIATFARPGELRIGIGSALFRETERAARALGFDWVNAAIRHENTGGSVYYQSRGFERYERTEKQVLMRFDLH